MTSHTSRDHEAAPLPAEDRVDSGDLKLTSSTTRSPAKKGLLLIWRAIRANITILALAALLLGGVVALIVFIARTATP